ncbi:MAG TPA: NAD-dependent epimerase/dehydratase family protein [Acidimicrobiales bacterium]|nr:NAD-dependent epimerase/dehydratase family protein [Acidimicrobiales bacterium]
MGARSILVTGAAGFVGRHTASALVRTGHNVTGLDVRPAPSWLDIPFCQIDVVDAAYLARSGGFDVVVHNAAITDTTETDVNRLRAVNTDATLRLAQACSDAGAAFVYASSFSVYGAVAHRVAVREEDIERRDVCSGPLNPYAASKLAADEALAADPPSSPWVGVRYTNVFGPDEVDKGPMASILSQIVRRAVVGDEVILFSDTLDAGRDYIPVQAVAAAIAACVDQPPPSGIYNLGSSVAVTFATLLDWVRAIVPSFRVRLVRNVHAARYQYWTCADMTRLRREIPELARWDESALHAEIVALWEELAEDLSPRHGGSATTVQLES